MSKPYSSVPKRLRKAAEVLQERAEAATPGPWKVMGYDPDPDDEGVALLGAADTVSGSHMIGYFHVGAQTQMEADGAYTQTMDPNVGLAVAHLLDQVAQAAQGASRGEVPFEDAALAIADQIIKDGRERHEVRYDVDYDPDGGDALSWSVRMCDCDTPWRHS